MLVSSNADFSYGPVLAIVPYKVPAADPRSCKGTVVRWGWSIERVYELPSTLRTAAAHCSAKCAIDLYRAVAGQWSMSPPVLDVRDLGALPTMRVEARTRVYKDRGLRLQASGLRLLSLSLRPRIFPDLPNNTIKRIRELVAEPLHT